MSYNNFKNTYLSILPNEIQDIISYYEKKERYNKIHFELQNKNTLFDSKLKFIISNNYLDIYYRYTWWIESKKIQDDYLKNLRLELSEWTCRYNNKKYGNYLMTYLEILENILRVLTYQELFALSHFISIKQNTS